jgi:hypothetical protein
VTISNDYTTSQIPFPNSLNLSATNVAAEWRKFDARWRNCEIATDLAAASTKKRVAVFLACAGNEAQELFDTFDLSEESREKIEDVVDAFK